MRETTPRVQYHAGQYLRREDLADDQAYHLAMRRRHLIAHHTWGIVRGLDLVMEQQTVLVNPGLAVDGYGRELVVGRRRPLPSTAFDDRRSDTLDLWILYDLQEAETAPAGYAERLSGEPAPVRWSEEPRLEWRAADSARPDPRHPPGVSEGDLDFGPERQPPDDPRLRWPIYLGRVRRQLEEEPPFQINPEGRPYAGLVGHSFEPPWHDGSRLTLGADGEERQFAIHLPTQDGTPEAKFEIRRGGPIAMHGNTNIEGDLRLGGGIDFRLGTKTAATPRPPKPWQVYLAEEGESQELRIEMERSAEGLNRVVVGSFSEESQAFEPALTVAGNRTVTVHGDLVVEGLVVRGPREEEPSVTPEAKSYLLSGFLGGLSAAGGAEQYGEQTSAAELLGDIARAATQPALLSDLAAELEKEAPQLLDALKRAILRATGEAAAPWS